ncbi:MAG: putative zinc-binding peptidase [Anaerolineae bacterium]|nr:putative zinc-binding peptidase [Anaerolineae bacterium]
MKSFQCQNCGQLLFFENTQCLNCGYQLGYLPEMAELSALDGGGNGLWQPLATRLSNRQFRLCANYQYDNLCNWLIPADSLETLCQACRLNQTIPNLSDEKNLERWRKLEVAKRRMVYSLLVLGLPVMNKHEDPERGLAFDLLAPSSDPNAEPVLTGHDKGLITINISEADSVVREQTRLEMNEPYRTLLGHFRHEVGHYYWMLLIQDTSWLEPFRKLFGDEREDYAQALERHYQSTPPSNWQAQFVSVYAAAHAWEDWAETWAHYLHITDAIETAQEFGVSVQLQTESEQPTTPITQLYFQPFEHIVDAWLPLTYAINSINRSMGQPDVYPFVLSSKAIEKLSFVHEVIRSNL